jgi:hypothetical protein
MSAAILNALWTKLQTGTGASGFMTTFGSRVYLDRAPADAILPLCVYSVTQDRLERYMSGRRDHAVQVVFRMFDNADSTTSIVSGQTRLKTLIDGSVLTATGYDRVVCLLRSQGSPVMDDDAWSIEDIYELRGSAAS